MGIEEININYDVRTDASGYDPDKYSKTLKYYHKLLWSKKLPNNIIFHLSDLSKKDYLFHKSEIGTFYLSSDSIIHTYDKWKKTQYLINQIPEMDIQYFNYMSYTIGAFILFPANKINGMFTINQARGINNKICDRFDLTLECIRRFYLNLESPLFDTLNRYQRFF